jgi:PAT family beta-lactamase induction signal transducer AmpG
MTTQTASAPQKRTMGQVFALIFTDRQVLAMFLLGLTSGLPYVLVGGTLNAWMTTVGVKPSTIGLLSWVALAYVFKFMWASAFQSRRTPFSLPIGPRRFWMTVFLALMVGLMFLLAFSDPPEGLARIGLLGVLIALFSSCFDIVQAAWKIEIARDDAHLDILCTIEQFGYRLASILGGAVALIVAEYIGWRDTFIGASGVLALSGLGIYLAEPARVSAEDLDVGIRQGKYLSTRTRNIAIGFVLLCWGVAFAFIVQFMYGALTDPANHSPRSFIRLQGPAIVSLTIIVLGVVAAVLVKKDGAQTGEKVSGEASVLNVFYRAILEPMMELVGRLRWSTILILMLILSYRFTDAIWGSFAYPFYLGTDYGALGHTLTEVGLASKTIGVAATVLGIAAGGVTMLRFGRMPVYVAGAFLAAITNLLYADLALDAHYMDAFLNMTHLDDMFKFLHLDQKMARLITTIFMENVAGGVASAASIAFLSSIVNKKYAAVQYALLVSLTFLLGILGRPTIGAIIETDGFAHAFILCAWFGAVAVVLSILEWMRQKGVFRRRV